MSPEFVRYARIKQGSMHSAQVRGWQPDQSGLRENYAVGYPRFFVSGVLLLFRRFSVFFLSPCCGPLTLFSVMVIRAIQTVQIFG